MDDGLRNVRPACVYCEHCSVRIAALLAVILCVSAGLAATYGPGYDRDHERSVDAVLGSGDSLSDVISGTYARPEDDRPKPVALKRPKVVPAKRARQPTRLQSFADGYRTVCVRLCDGYYFPISASTSPDTFDRDEAACSRSCSSPAKLFVYRNRDGSPEEMVDRDGYPYLGLSTAFQHRTTYDASCTCKPQPWSQEAKDQHRLYALQEARDRGDLVAAADVPVVEATVTHETSGTGSLAGAETPRAVAKAAVAAASAKTARVAAKPTSAQRHARTRDPVREAKVWTVRAKRAAFSSAKPSWRSRGLYQPTSASVRLSAYRNAIRATR